MNLIKFLTSNLLFFSVLVGFGKPTDVKLWYDKPANDWESEALPIGNGRLGAMLFGGIQTEKVQFNEQSLWSGSNNWDGTYDLGDLGFGTYKNFGDFTIGFRLDGEATGYSRSLDIIDGVHFTQFASGGARFYRAAFASYPDQVMVFQYSASKHKKLTGKISLHSAQGAKTLVEGNSLYFKDVMPNELKYAAILQVKCTGGTTKANENWIEFTHCNTLTLILSAHTNYKPDFKSGWRGEDPYALCQKELDAVSLKNFKQLLKTHNLDFSGLMKRVKIDIGNSSEQTKILPVDKRLAAFKSGGADPDLEELMFQYGRYLLVSSSRPGGLPANLQGVWNNSNNPPWASDYHNNINIQMNYWAAETTNLPECHLPLIDFIAAQSEPCRIATRKAFGNNRRGWTARTSQNIFGGNGWEWNIPASAWYMQHVYEHWAFTHDMDYLKQKAYPLIKEIVEFWEDNLKKLPDGTLVVPNGWSPEHGPREDGVMHDQQLVWDLFQNYTEMAEVLGVDPDYRAKVEVIKSKLAPNKTGKWGQLQEWQEDRDDPDDQHRHTSHLFAVYPGRQINLLKTPELANAAIISLRSRSGNYGKNKDKPFTVESTVGDSRRSWTWPWRCAMWARLGDGEKAGINIRGLLTYNTLPNLFCSHPPFQLDGNFGIPAAMAEMLLQSHAGEIQLLPAIPAEWGKNGSFEGLKARGGYTVGCQWKEGKVIRYSIKSENTRTVMVRVNSKVEQIKTKSN